MRRGFVNNSWNKEIHKFIYGRRSLLLTDHRQLISILGSKKGIPAYTANRLQHWGTVFTKLRLSEGIYTFKRSFKADTNILKSRWKDTVIATLKGESEIKGMFGNTARELPVTAEEFKVRNRWLYKENENWEGNSADLCHFKREY